MITTKDGVQKKRGDKVWGIGILNGEKHPAIFTVHGQGSNNYDAYLEMRGCWHDRDKCLKECAK